jgi:hypothetical protein
MLPMDLAKRINAGRPARSAFRILAIIVAIIYFTVAAFFGFDRGFLEWGVLCCAFGGFVFAAIGVTGYVPFWSMRTKPTARKLALSRYVFIVAAIVLVKLIRDVAIGAVGQGPLGTTIDVAATVFIVAYVLWMFFWWRPNCPKCRIARAKFTRQDGHEERLVCAACGYDEPTGITPGQGSD